MVRYDYSRFRKIAGILILVQMERTILERCDQQWDSMPITRAAYARIQFDGGVLSRWKSLSALHIGTQWTEAILDGSILFSFGLFERAHVLLESGAKTFCGAWDLQNDELK